MVALVATAVCSTYQLRHYTNLKSQLYAAIHEWRLGDHEASEFSANAIIHINICTWPNAYLDVYNGHISTLNHIRDQPPVAFHVMMMDLYNLARCSSRVRYYDHH